MSKITLEQQIMLTTGRINERKNRDSDAPLDESILDSLKRLQDIENKEPVAYINASSVLELINMGSAEVYSKKYSASSLPLYTLPVKG